MFIFKSSIRIKIEFEKITNRVFLDVVYSSNTMNRYFSDIEATILGDYHLAILIYKVGIHLKKFLEPSNLKFKRSIWKWMAEIKRSSCFWSSSLGLTRKFFKNRKMILIDFSNKNEKFRKHFNIWLVNGNMTVDYFLAG